MSEFIREVDEDYRHDQIRNLVSRYWVALLGLAVIVLVSTGVWRFSVYYRQQRDETAGSRYFEATQALAGNPAGSLAALDGLAKDGPAGYRLLARFKAAAQVSQTDAAAGAKAFDALAGDQDIDADLREIARLRAAILLMNTADPAEIHRRFEPLADANAPFRNVAREMLAVSALARGDDADAKRWLDAELADPIASQDQRQRAGLFLGLIRSGKPGEIAPVPAPAPIPAPAPPPDGADAKTPSADGPAMTPPPESPSPPVTKPNDAPATAPVPTPPANATPPAAVEPPSSETKPLGTPPAASEATPPALATPPDADRPQPAKP